MTVENSMFVHFFVDTQHALWQLLMLLASGYCRPAANFHFALSAKKGYSIPNFEETG